MPAFVPNPDQGLFDMIFGGFDAGAQRLAEAEARKAALRGAPQPGGTSEWRGRGATGSWGDEPPQGPLYPIPDIPVPQTAPPPRQAAPGGPALPRAMGSQPQPAAAPPGPPAGGREADLLAEQARLMQGPDRSAMEAAYKRNQQEGSQGLLLALAAQEAGNQPIGAHYLKRAAEAGQPMKTAGGTMTASGFIPDADYANNQQLALVNQKIAREQHIIDAATSEKTKMAAEERRQKFEMEKLRISEAGAWGRANLAASTKAAGAGAGGRTTEDQGKAAGWFVSGRQAMNDMRRVLTEDPKAADMGFGERTAIAVLPRSLGEDAANAMRSPARQQFVNAAEAMTDSLLRAATGAGVNYDEAERKRRQLIPQLGDSAAVKEQKLRNYETEMAALAARAGPALDKLPPTMGGHGMPTPPLSPVQGGGGGLPPGWSMTTR